MPPHLTPYIPMFVMTVVVVGGVLSIFVANHLLGPRRATPSKGDPFECGNPPGRSTRRRFAIKYYMVALLFLVFDVEAVFLYPWASEYRRFLADPQFATVALVEMLLFVGVLGFGLVYVWRRGALTWE
jgi:NADH-quinone oxidoreductase subunit A